MQRHQKNGALKASVREAVFGRGLTLQLAADALGLTVGQVAGIAHRTPHRLRTSLTVPSS